MRFVLMTAFGVPVDPDVNRNFAIVSGPTAAWAASTRASGSARRYAHEVTGWLGGGLRVTTISTSAGTTASIARANGAPSLAKTSAGVTRPMMVRSLP